MNEYSGVITTDMETTVKEGLGAHGFGGVWSIQPTDRQSKHVCDIMIMMGIRVLTNLKCAAVLSMSDIVWFDF